jgi:hypothetical protein
MIGRAESVLFYAAKREALTLDNHLLFNRVLAWLENM